MRNAPGFPDEIVGGNSSAAGLKRDNPEDNLDEDCRLKVGPSATGVLLRCGCRADWVDYKRVYPHFGPPNSACMAYFSGAYKLGP